MTIPVALRLVVRMMRLNTTPLMCGVEGAEEYIPFSQVQVRGESEEEAIAGRSV